MTAAAVVTLIAGSILDLYGWHGENYAAEAPGLLPVLCGSDDRPGRGYDALRRCRRRAGNRARGPASRVATGPPVALAATVAGVTLGPDEWRYLFPILYSPPFAWLACSRWTGRLHAGRAAS